MPVSLDTWSWCYDSHWKALPFQNPWPWFCFPHQSGAHCCCTAHSNWVPTNLKPSNPSRRPSLAYEIHNIPHKSVFLTGWCRFMGSCRATDTQYTSHTAWWRDPPSTLCCSLEFHHLLSMRDSCRPRPLPLLIRTLLFLNLSWHQTTCLIPRPGLSITWQDSSLVPRPPTQLSVACSTVLQAMESWAGAWERG